MAAYLFAQLEDADAITANRLASWNCYHSLLANLEADGRLRRPMIPPQGQHNGHLYSVLLNSAEERDRVLAAMKAYRIGAVFHYIPLHSAPAGRRFGRTHGDLARTDDLSRRLIRLPMFYGVTDAQQQAVRDVLSSVLENDGQ